MLDSYVFLPIFLSATRLATTYSEGSYGSGGYNEGESLTSPSPSPAPTETHSPNVTTTQVSEAPTATASNQPDPVADTPSRITATAPAAQQNTAAQSDTPVSTDFTWIIVGSIITAIVLIALLMMMAKKLSHR